ncbi:TetR/AcrR family transcriptional regulator [Protaetiibacter intestinalis]|uniref:TetR/AcrR family transcriptional regulator n=1 Tax=Protaetiibacter intestinalis TaxID=2419774 RepID=A0A387BAD6_9MICO|nr:TetR/AcrR family transcriptional regulator [Protaetiibacter intestinalis]AYF99323.1 TetR/AcrR family transcriptional regulator [Protaetiibacter intestinalis]
MTLEKATRRRGTELEDAILDAVWDEISEKGYGGLTFEGVASRAQTSRAVLYRRWPTREELVLAAIRRLGARTPTVSPDTGSLREDMLALLRFSNEHRLGMWVVLSVQLAGFYAETGITPAELRTQMLGERPSLVPAILARAAERGEARADVSERVARSAFDLFRSEAILRLGPVPDEVLVEIVDEVFLPLVRA